MSVFEMAVAGPAGEPVDLRRTFWSHGVASLPPMRTGERGSFFEVTLPLDGFSARTVRVEEAGPGRAKVAVKGRTSAKARAQTEQVLRYVLRLDEDLSEFYELAANDPDLVWVTGGSARLIRNPTVFEEVVKTVCTTNCSWSLTKRMVSSLVEQLGASVPGAPPEGPEGRAFPTPAAMASRDERFYREVIRAGYRAPYFVALAESVASGAVDIEAWGRASPDELPDEELAKLLVGLPGVGPYAAAHIMMMLGRYSLLILDSWTRPKYARLKGRKQIKDATIARHFKRYGRYAGLAFWMYLTRDWLEED